MNEIPVYYHCWGCGSEVVAYEEATENVPSKTIWNVCPDCQENKGKG